MLLRACRWKDEWRTLYEKSKDRLAEDQIIFLLALREVGDDFGFAIKQCADYDIQVELAIQSILKNENRWIDYICKGEPPMSYLHFFATKGGPMGTGWTKRPQFEEDMIAFIETIRKEIDFYEYT